MIRLIAAAAILFFVGTTLILSEFRPFRHQTLAARVSPYLPGGRTGAPLGLLSLESFGQLLAPLSELIGSSAARVFGVSEELPRRLRRVHADMDETEFRLRQVGWAAGSMAMTVLVGVALSLPLGLVAVFGLIAPLLAFLILEQQLANESEQWKARTFLELPIISEQIAMLLGSGYSLGAALRRVSERGSGVVAQDLSVVMARVRQGTSEQVALTEWADTVGVEAVSRLVSILSLNKEAGDLGSMVAAEARNVRTESHRELLEAIEKKNQQVWIPVTLAALIPGVILMMIPFISALAAFG